MNTLNKAQKLVARLLTPAELVAVSGGADYTQNKGPSGDYCMYAQTSGDGPYKQVCQTAFE